MNEFDYLAKAKKNMEKEKYHEVISFCDKALKINSNLPEAYSFKGNALYNLGEYDDAAESFSHAIEKEPDEAEHYYDRSWSYCNMDKFEDAIVDMNKALEIEPKTSAFYYDRGRFEYWAERYKDAVISFTKGIELKPTENKYLFRGNSYMALEEFDLALADFNSAIEIDPEFARAYYRRGILYKKMELLENAAKDFKKAIELDPKCDDAMTELGFILIQMGKKDAMKYFNQAIKAYSCSNNYYLRIVARQKILARENSLTKLSAGEFFQDDCDINKIFNEKQATDDIKDLNKAIASDPDGYPLYEMRAERFMYLKDYKNAIEDYNFLIENSSENHSYYKMRGFCKECTGLYEEALQDCEESIELNNGYADFTLFRTRGLANYKLSNYELALINFSQILEMEENSEIYYLRGLVNCWLKNYFEAYFDFAKALELNPDIESDFDEKIPFLIGMILAFRDGFNKDEKIPQKRNGSPIGLNGIK